MTLLEEIEILEERLRHYVANSSPQLLSEGTGLSVGSVRKFRDGNDTKISTLKKYAKFFDRFSPPEALEQTGPKAPWEK